MGMGDARLGTPYGMGGAGPTYDGEPLRGGLTGERGSDDGGGWMDEGMDGWGREGMNE